MVIEETINGLFSRLTAGDLAECVDPVQDGWEAELPSGLTVARSMLQAAARPLVALGPYAVPHLLPWVMNENPALRYVAVYALEQITGEKPYLPYFDRVDYGENCARAIEVWKRWWARLGLNQ